ncbi:hypothetical protein Cva_00811 [Caedimonas varicaedens]|uniref:Uncharacterized protein n=1 Tax=Caedimonas varicaedens TaxID=1629334 RepID=A0A0K8MD67_9PROT|nr:hypothetical protein Cva_00811 [Caedimonas varicaedens]
MLSHEQKEEIVSYLLNCKLIYQSKNEISQVSRIRKLLEFCDPDKLIWQKLEANVLDFCAMKLALSAADFIDIGNKLFSRWR